MGIYRLAVVGESFVNSDGSTRQGEIKRCRVGEPVQLVREPDNSHDSGAVAVLSPRGVQIGYLSREAGWVGAAIDAGRPFKAKIEAINSRPGELTGVVLLCASDGDAVPPAVAPAAQPSRRHEAMAAAVLQSKPRDSGCLLFIVIVGTLLGLAMCNRSPDVEVPPPTPAQEAQPVTARALFRAYQDNEARAQRDYGNRQLRVSGTVSGVDLDFSNEPVVKLVSDNQYMPVVANLIDADQPRGADMNAGDEIVLVCNSVMEIVGMPILSGCFIVP